MLTITAERLSFMMEEEGLAEVAKVTAMSLLSIVVSYLVMSNWSMQTMMLTFPELILGVVFVDILVGRWVGIQLLEYWRFRRLFRPEGLMTMFGMAALALSRLWRQWRRPWRSGWVLGTNERNRRFIAPYNPRRQRRLADDKVLAKNVMRAAGIPVPATYAVVDSFAGVSVPWLSSRAAMSLS